MCEKDDKSMADGGIIKGCQGVGSFCRRHDRRHRGKKRLLPGTITVRVLELDDGEG